MTKFPVYPNSDTPWMRLLQHIPFAHNVCVAGSVGTWFAHLALTGFPPLWLPGDVDVFVLTQSDSDFAQMVKSVAQVVYAESDSLHHQMLRVEAALAGTRKHVVDLYVDGIGNLSFIQVTHGDSIEDWVECLLVSFDISVCKVSLHRYTDSAVVEDFQEKNKTVVEDDNFHYFIEIDAEVCVDIAIGQMEVSFIPSSRFWTQYLPGMRNLRRLEKYEARGYRLSKITFELQRMTVLQFASIFETPAHKNSKLPKISN
jgi:hypothetical protein